MKLRYWCLPVFAVAALLGVAAPARAQYDAPSLVVNRTGFFRIDLDVHAGVSGAPEGFVVQWMKKSDFQAWGWPSGEYSSHNQACDFTGTPTLNMDARSTTFDLATSGAIQVQMGDLFDETGVTSTYVDNLVGGTYVFRAWAKGAAGYASGPSNTVEATTTPAECTQGFWKTHPGVWPASCLPMLLGTVSYTQAQLLAIYGTPAAGNGLISLAHQLITAKLNGCNGSNLTPIAATIAAAVGSAEDAVPLDFGFAAAPTKRHPLTRVAFSFSAALRAQVALETRGHAAQHECVEPHERDQQRHACGERPRGRDRRQCLRDEQAPGQRQDRRQDGAAAGRVQRRFDAHPRERERAHHQIAARETAAPAGVGRRRRSLRRGRGWRSAGRPRRFGVAHAGVTTGRAGRPARRRCRRRCGRSTTRTACRR